MLWKGSRESQSQAEVTGGSVNIPEGFRGEGKLSGSSSSFSIDVEDDSCQDPLQNQQTAQIPKVTSTRKVLPSSNTEQRGRAPLPLLPRLFPSSPNPSPGTGTEGMEPPGAGGHRRAGDVA